MNKEVEIKKGEKRTKDFKKGKERWDEWKDNSDDDSFGPDTAIILRLNLRASSNRNSERNIYFLFPTDGRGYCKMEAIHQSSAVGAWVILHSQPVNNRLSSDFINADNVKR